MKSDEELFDEWETAYNESEDYANATERGDMRNAFLAALKIERERCAKLCESMMYDHGPFGGELIYRECAAAIRGGNNTVECKWEDNCK